MARYLLLALNGPTRDDLEGTYNDWYRDVHVPALRATEGVVDGQQFKVIHGNNT